MLRRLLTTTWVFVLASGCGFAVNLGLARWLPPAGYAAYALAFGVFSCLALLGDLGVKQNYARHFLSAKPGTYDWPRILLADVPRPGLVVLGGAAVALFAYPGLGPAALIAVAGGSLCYVVAQWLTVVLRSVTLASWLPLLQRGLPIGLLAAAPLLVLAARRGVALSGASGVALFAVNAAMLVLTVGVAWRLLPQGEARFEADHRADGRGFSAMLVAGALFFYGDRLLVARLCPAATFATYSLLAVFFQAFDLLVVSSDFVLGPRYARDGASRALSLLGKALLVLVPLGLATALAASWAIARFYPRYLPISPWLLAGFAAGGVAKVGCNVVMTAVNVAAPPEVLRPYQRTSTALVVGTLGLLVVATWRFGAPGAAVAVAVGWGSRLALAIDAVRRATAPASAPIVAGA